MSFLVGRSKGAGDFLPTVDHNLKPLTENRMRLTYRWSEKTTMGKENMKYLWLKQLPTTGSFQQELLNTNKLFQVTVLHGLIYSMLGSDKH